MDIWIAKKSSQVSRAFFRDHFLRTVLSRYVKKDPSSLKFIKGRHGKPRLTRQPSTRRVHFNLSHTQDYFVLAISQTPVGIDIESTSRKAPIAKLAKRWFSADHQERLFKLPSTDQKIYFFQIWTTLEAYLKMKGSGLGPIRTIQKKLKINYFRKKSFRINFRGTQLQSLKLPRGLTGVVASARSLERSDSKIRYYRVSNLRSITKQPLEAARTPTEATADVTPAPIGPYPRLSMKSSTLPLYR